MDQIYNRKLKLYMARGIPKQEAQRRAKQAVDSKRNLAVRGGMKNKAVRSMVKVRGARNGYLARLMDPSIGGGIPDIFTGLTHCAFYYQENDLEFINGVSSGALFPNLVANAYLTRSAADQAAAEVFEERFEGGASKMWWFNNAGIVKPSPVRNVGAPSGYQDGIGTNVALTAGDGVFCSLAFPYREKSDGTQEHDIMFEKNTSTGVSTILSGARVTATDSCFIKLDTNNTTAANIQLGIVTSTDTGSLVVTLATPVTGGTATSTVAVPATHTLIYGVVVKSASSADITIMDLSIKVTRTIAAPHHTEQGALPFGNPNGSDLAALQGLVTKYRPVGFAAWVDYNGAKTSDGKFIGVSNRNKTRPGEHHDLREHSEISSIPGRYSGDLSKGGYLWYMPTDRSDFEWRDLDYNGPDNNLLFCCTAHDAPAEHVTLKRMFLIEFQTTSQLLGPLPSEANERELEEAFKALANESGAMENSFHFQKLARILARGSKWGGRLLGIASPLIAGFNPVLGASTAALGSAATPFSAAMNEMADDFSNL